MSRRLNDLSSDFLPLATMLLARLVERGVPVLIVDTLRTEAEHQENLRRGTSKTALSRHLPRRLRTPIPPSHPDAEKSDAIDVAPYEQFLLHGADKLQWDPADPVWGIIQEEVEKLGLISGRRWRDPHDPGHAELKREVWAR